MSWLYSQALVEAYLEGTCSDGAPFAPSSGSPTPQAYLPPDRMTAFYRPSRFGMTFAPLTDDRGAELLTWCLGAFRARTFQPPAKAQESTGNAPACGDRWRELSVRYDRDTCSWRTHRSLWDEDLSACSLTLPKWGLMRDGVLSELMPLEHRTAATDAGLLPTPLASNTKAHHMWSGGRPARSYFPTPTASAGGPEPEGKTGRKLATVVKTWPTPTVNDSKNCTLPPSQIKHDNIPGAVLRNGETAGSPLNPTWVEKLMGWPEGWTDIGASDATKERASKEDLRTMRPRNYSTALGERQIGQPVFGTPVLQHYLRWLSEHGHPCDWKKASTAIEPDGVLQQMPVRGTASETPQGSQPDEQRSGEHRGSLPSLPHQRASVGRNMGPWAEGWEEGIPRVAQGVTARVDRLKAIGNGQVPQCAVEAWRILTHNAEVTGSPALSASPCELPGYASGDKNE